MRAAGDWLAYSGTAWTGRSENGWAHLSKYSARYKILGQGRPIVLIPGMAGGMSLLGQLANELARSHRVICLHLRGEDDPFALRQKFGLSDLADDVDEMISWLGLEQPALFGVSFGGVVALELARRRPWRLGALLLQGVASCLEPGFLQRLAGLVLSRYQLPSDSPFFNQFYNLFFGGKQKAGRLFDFVVRTCWSTDQAVMAHRFKLLERADFREQLGKVWSPALLMAGSKDILASPKGLASLASQIPDARALTIAGAGHLAAVTHPARIAREVSSFLESVEY